MKFCQKCGAKNDDAATFCRSCGTKIASIPTAAPASAPEVKKPEAAPAPPVAAAQQKPPTAAPASASEVKKPEAAPVPPVAAAQQKPSAAAPRQNSMAAQSPANMQEHKPAVDQVKKALQEEKPKKKMKKGMLIGIIVASVLLVGAIVAGIIFLKWYFSPEQELLRAVESGNLEEAAELVEDERSLRRNEEFLEALHARIETVKSEFAAGSKEYTQVMVELDTIEEMDVDDVREAISEAREYAHRLNGSHTCFATGESFFAEGYYLDAMEQYAQVIEEDRNYETAQAKHAESITKYREKMLADAEKYASMENYADAIEVLEVALETLTDDAVLTEQIAVYEKESNDKVRADALADAEKLASGGDYAGAIEVLQDGLKTLPDDSALTQQIALYEKASEDKVKADALAAAKEYADQGDYTAAMKVLSDYTDAHGKDADVSVAYNDYTAKYVDTALTEAAALAGESKFDEALSVIDTAMESSDDSRLEPKRKEYEKAYADSVLAQADALLAEGKYDDAKSLVNTALKTISGNEALNQKLKDIENAKPVYLHTLEPINGGFSWNEGDPADPFGNAYSGLQNYVIFHGSDYWGGHDAAETYSVEYKVDEKYDALNFVMTPYSDFGAGAGSYVQIYVNGNHRYTSQWIGQKTEPFSVPTIDISDATYIKIVVHVGGHGCLMLSEVTLSNPVGFESKLTEGNTTLHSLSTFNGSLVWHNEYPADAVESDYSNVWNYSVLHAKDYWGGHDAAETHSAEYYVNGKYAAISMDIAPATDFGQGGSAVVKIYIDDVLSYTSEPLTQKTQRFNTGEIDLTGATYLKVVVEVQGHSCTILSNVLLKNLE